MRARVAYISSFGTTTILVGGALLMLAVGSAIVAFRGWPGGATDTGVQSVPLAPHSATADAAATKRATPVHRVERATSRRTRATRLSTAGLVKTTGTARVVPGIVMVPNAPAPMAPTRPAPPSSPAVQAAPPAQPDDDPVPVDDPGVPDPGPLPVELPDLGGTPMPLPDSNTALPSSNQVTAMVLDLIPPLPNP